MQPKSFKVVVLVLLVLSPRAVGGSSTATVELLGRVDELEYNLDYDGAIAALRDAIQAAPDDPAAYRALAVAYWLEMGMRRGTITADMFLEGANAVEKGHAPPPDLAAGFRANVQRALALSEQQVRARPGDPDAHYQLAATVTVMASYAATIDGRVFGAIRSARRAYEESEKVLELDPGRTDAGLIAGTYEYVVSTLSFPKRFMARIAGFGGDRARAIERIERAARRPGPRQTDARYTLIIVYNRERRYDDALAVLRLLEQRYPRNRLLWLEAGGTAYRAGRFQEAEVSLEEGFRRLAADSRPRAFGEEALWYYKRGAVRVALKQADTARADLRKSLELVGRSWVHGRAHTELGKIADLAGDRQTAVSEYRVALQLTDQDGDDVGATDAKRLMEEPYRASARATS